MNPHILDRPVQKFINDHLTDDITRILLKKSPFLTVSAKELAGQIDSKQRSEKKLPLWFHTENIYYPAKLSVEQSSSGMTAAYKSNLVSGDTLIDLTGGFGVDSFYFSWRIKNVTCCEQDPELSAISKHNAEVLGADNIRFITGDSMEYLRNSPESFDTIFADPSRRINNSKVFMLKDCEPDVIRNASLMLSKAARIIIKTSPLLDIRLGFKELQYVSQIHVISVKNDCKELLWIIDRGFADEPEICCAAISESGRQVLTFKLSEESSAAIESYGLPERYLYEPDVALLKAGCFKLIARKFGINKLHSNTHLYSSATLNKEFIGRKFEVLNVFDYKDFIKGNSIKQANIISRNFPYSPDELRKKHKITDGSNDYLIFTTARTNQLLVIHAKKVIT